MTKDDLPVCPERTLAAVDVKVRAAEAAIFAEEASMVDEIWRAGLRFGNAKWVLAVRRILLHLAVWYLR